MTEATHPCRRVHDRPISGGGSSAAWLRSGVQHLSQAHAASCSRCKNLHAPRMRRRVHRLWTSRPAEAADAGRTAATSATRESLRANPKDLYSRSAAALPSSHASATVRSRRPASASSAWRSSVRDSPRPRTRGESPKYTTSTQSAVGTGLSSARPHAPCASCKIHHIDGSWAPVATCPSMMSQVRRIWARPGQSRVSMYEASSNRSSPARSDGSHIVMRSWPVCSAMGAGSGAVSDRSR